MSLKNKVAEFFDSTSLDAFVAHSYVNVSYLSKANIFTQKLIPDRLALILWPRDSEPVLILCSIEEVAARRDSLISDIRTYVEHKESPIKVLAETVRERKLGEKRIGFEENALTANYYNELLRLLPEANFVGCDKDLARMRMVKDDHEIQHIKEITLITDRAIAAACRSAQPGTSEREIAHCLREFLYENGAVEISHMIVSVGDNVRDVHHLPGDARVRKGDSVHVDAGAKFGNYFSDLGRMAVVGAPTQEQLESYRLVWESVQNIIDGTRPGVRAKDLYAIYKTDSMRHKLFDERLCPHVGHGLGVELHEAPILEPLNEEELRPGMVLAIEVAHRALSGHIYHTEDLVYVTGKGSEVISRSRDWKQLLVAE